MGGVMLGFVKGVLWWLLNVCKLWGDKRRGRSGGSSRRRREVDRMKCRPKIQGADKHGKDRH